MVCYRRQRNLSLYKNINFALQRAISILILAQQCYIQLSLVKILFAHFDLVFKGDDATTTRRNQYTQTDESRIKTRVTNEESVSRIQTLTERTYVLWWQMAKAIGVIHLAVTIVRLWSGALKWHSTSKKMTKWRSIWEIFTWPNEQRKCFGKACEYRREFPF